MKPPARHSLKTIAATPPQHGCPVNCLRVGYAGSIATIIGKGPSLADGHLVECERPFIGINDVPLVLHRHPEHHATCDFMVALDDWACYYEDSGLPPYCKAVVPVNRKPLRRRDFDHATFLYHPLHDRHCIRKDPSACPPGWWAHRSALYAKHSTAVTAVHLAWLLGCRGVRFVGIDGGHHHAPGFTFLCGGKPPGDDTYTIGRNLALHLAHRLGLETYNPDGTLLPPNPSTTNQ